MVYASPTDILVAGGAAGSNLAEDINVTSTNSRNGTPYSGTARGWFSDGGYFYTSVGKIVTIYSSTSVQQEIISLADTNGIHGVHPPRTVLWADYGDVRNHSRLARRSLVGSRH